MSHKRNSAAIALALCATLAAGALTACSNDVGPPTENTGMITPFTIEDDFFDEVVETQGKPGKGWLSAPWGVGAKIDAKSTKIPIIYVAGDTACTGPAGFTLKESKDEVTIGVYTIEVEREGKDAEKPCPTNPAGVFKYGSVKLSEPLGDRKLMHAGLEKRYQEFKWQVLKTEEPTDNEGEDAKDTEDASPSPSPEEDQ
ncbi:MAG: hypothetical protein FWD29_00630 [Micrococcales bacterium]|nr:hypothetical protein [Micrococcales bacterium]